MGVIIGISNIQSIKDGIIIPGDGAAYYDTVFEAITFKPEMQEVLPGNISEITDFGAFIDIGTIDGMIHISQTMDDFVSFSKTNTLTGKQSKNPGQQNDSLGATLPSRAANSMGFDLRQGVGESRNTNTGGRGG